MATLARRLSLAGLVAAAAVLVAASPALAHNFYVSSTPGENEVLTTLPGDFIVTTNDNLLDLGGAGGGFVMQVTDSGGLYYGDGCVTVNGPSVSMAAALGAEGDYTLTWQVISADGHTIAGEIPFRWEPATDVAASTGAATPPVCGEAGGAPGDEPDAISTAGPVPDAAENTLGDALWIGGAVVAVAIAVVATLLMLRRRPTA